MLTEFDITGKVALITGSGRGIGAGVARVFAEAGADIALNALTGKHLEPLAAEIAAASGRTVKPYPADLTESKSVDSTVAAVLRDFGRIDILVNGVGDAIPKPIIPLPGAANDRGLLTDEELKKIMDLNLTSAILCARAVGPHMLERRSGKVITISSFAARKGGSGMAIYAIAKTGLNGFTRALGLEWAPYNVQVNAIAPGIFPDPVTGGPDAIERADERAKTTIPMGRAGRLREVGLLAVYLASAASDYMTGETIHLDGGMTAQ